MIRMNAPDAVAQVSGSDATHSLNGTVRLYQQEGHVLVTAHICGLPPESESGFFGFHIHEGTSCSDGFVLTGGHFNPAGFPHPRHAGDLPPLLSCAGEAVMVVMTDRFRVDDVIGRTIVIHDRLDDFTSQPAGNAGTKIACGVIRAGS